MPNGYRITLGSNRELNSGDSSTSSTSSFTTYYTIGSGTLSYFYFLPQSVSGTYYLGTDLEVYFVPNSNPPFGAINFQVGTAPSPTFQLHEGSASDETYTDDNDSAFIFGDGDTSLVGSGKDTIYANGGNDTVLTGDGGDVIFGGSGADTLNAGTGNDFVSGGTENDSIIGSSGNDVLFGDGGNDTIDAGADDDTVFGGSGSDSISGGDGNDALYGGGFDVGATEHLAWNLQSGSVTGGFTQDTGNIRVTFSYEDSNGGLFDDAVIDTTQQYVGAQPYNQNSRLRLDGDALTNANTTTSRSTLTFNADSGSGVTNEVANVNFRINDVDWENLDHRDQIIVYAYDANNNPVPVNLTLGGADVLTNGNTVTANDAADDPNTVGGSVLVEIAGPVHRVVVEFRNVGVGFQGVWLTDVYYNSLYPATDAADTIYGGNGNDIIDGGLGADQIFGDGGNDTIYGGDGNDSINYGFGNDIVYGGAGDDYIDDLGGRTPPPTQARSMAAQAMTLLPVAREATRFTAATTTTPSSATAATITSMRGTATIPSTLATAKIRSMAAPVSTLFTAPAGMTSSMGAMAPTGSRAARKPIRFTAAKVPTASTAAPATTGSITGRAVTSSMAVTATTSSTT